MTKGPFFSSINVFRPVKSKSDVHFRRTEVENFDISLSEKNIQDYLVRGLPNSGDENEYWMSILQVKKKNLMRISLIQYIFIIPKYQDR